ncbi:MAG: type III pantothenate kinase [Candidatus Omnitrophota bacterium]
MIIGIDIGNTNLTVGYLNRMDVVRSSKVASDRLRGSGFKKVLREAFDGLGVSACDLEAIYICSVVPQLNSIVRHAVELFFKKPAMFVGGDVLVPLINHYRIPGQVGQDRLVGGYAALKLFGPGLIILDFGSAITFDIISKKSEYLGGLIVPGLKLMQEALNKKTALLPYVELARPVEMIGRDTVASIRAGIVYGVASLCDGIIARLRDKECKGYKVIATGGDVGLIQAHSNSLKTSEEHLVLKGLSFIHDSQKKKK